MNKYKIVYRCSNGFESEEVVYAVNRTMAFEVFEEFECFKDVVAADCFRVLKDEVN